MNIAVEITTNHGFYFDQIFIFLMIQILIKNTLPKTE